MVVELYRESLMAGNKSVEVGICRLGDDGISFDCLKGLLKDVLIDREGELIKALEGVLGGAER